LGEGSEGGKESARSAEECYLGYHFVESCCFEELVFVRDAVVTWFEIDEIAKFGLVRLNFRGL
jgi:hypothetical protein